jgi:putative FmdB family regulatory protein
LPLYEYRCTKCGHRFEKIQPFSAEPETQCPMCQGPLIRPLTAPAFQFKGAGWYVNDYAPKSSSASESPSESKPGAADDAKKSVPAADNKPAASAPASSPASPPASGSAKSDSAG